MTSPQDFISIIAGSFSMRAAENPTVAMVEASFAATATNAKYINCEVSPDQLGDAVRGAVAQGWAGFNCSMPHKVAILEYLDDISETARAIGAVNCITNDGGRLVGENTDGRGFVEALRETGNLGQGQVVILGSGGAARAIAIEMAHAGTRRILIVNRTAARGQTLVDLVNAETAARAELVVLKGTYAVPATSAFVINATPVGMSPDTDAIVPIDGDSLQPGMIIADVVPNPRRTAFITDAIARGCVAIDGHRMLVNQAAVAIELWTGRPADKAAMSQRLLELFP